MGSLDSTFRYVPHPGLQECTPTEKPAEFTVVPSPKLRRLGTFAVNSLASGCSLTYLFACCLCLFACLLVCLFMRWLAGMIIHSLFRVVSYSCLLYCSCPFEAVRKIARAKTRLYCTDPWQPGRGNLVVTCCEHRIYDHKKQDMPWPFQCRQLTANTCKAVRRGRAGIKPLVCWPETLHPDSFPAH